jgi:hypothetical protein
MATHFLDSLTHTQKVFQSPHHATTTTTFFFQVLGTNEHVSYVWEASGVEREVGGRRSGKWKEEPGDYLCTLKRRRRWWW